MQGGVMKDADKHCFTGASDGSITSYVDGAKVASKTGMALTSSGTGIEYLMFETFFGGSSAMAAKKDEVGQIPAPMLCE
jgi:hypothetical protein